MESISPDAGKYCLSEPTGSTNQPVANSAKKDLILQAAFPDAKLSNLFTSCQEVCHTYVTYVVQYKWFRNCKAKCKDVSDIAAGKDTEPVLG